MVEASDVRSNSDACRVTESAVRAKTGGMPLFASEASLGDLYEEEPLYAVEEQLNHVLNKFSQAVGEVSGIESELVDVKDALALPRAKGDLKCAEAQDAELASVKGVLASVKEELAHTLAKLKRVEAQNAVLAGIKDELKSTKEELSRFQREGEANLKQALSQLQERHAAELKDALSQFQEKHAAELKDALSQFKEATDKRARFIEYDHACTLQMTICALKDKFVHDLEEHARAAEEHAHARVAEMQRDQMAKMLKGGDVLQLDPRLQHTEYVAGYSGFKSQHGLEMESMCHDPSASDGSLVELLKAANMTTGDSQGRETARKTIEELSAKAIDESRAIAERKAQDQAVAEDEAFAKRLQYEEAEEQAASLVLARSLQAEGNAHRPHVVDLQDPVQCAAEADALHMLMFGKPKSRYQPSSGARYQPSSGARYQPPR